MSTITDSFRQVRKLKVDGLKTDWKLARDHEIVFYVLRIGRSRGVLIYDVAQYRKIRNGLLKRPGNRT